MFITYSVEMQLIEPCKAGSKIRYWPRKAEKMPPLGNIGTWISDWKMVVNATYIHKLSEGNWHPERKKTALPVLTDK
jgi:hypothetical protein